VWAVGESDIREGSVAVGDYETLLLVDTLTRQGVLSALAEGRAAAVYNHKDRGYVLEHCGARAPGGASVPPGGEVVSRGPVVVSVRGRVEGKGVARVRIRFVCDGAVAHTAETVGLAFDAAYAWPLEGAAPGTRHYCRVIVDGLGELVTNPVFVRVPGR
jgi:hypothetical protein